MFEQESAFCAQINRGDHRLLAEFDFVVAMHAHSISMVAIVIEQQAVKAMVDQCFDACF